MKRALGLILIIAVCVVGFMSLRGVMPFMPVVGTSMEPELKAGDLIVVEKTSPSQVKVGDIIVFNVPAAVAEHYNYPPVAAHRVIKVNTEPSITFRTKGDNSGEDPFTTRAQDLRGIVSQQIPYLGLPLLFLQSTQGIIFVIIAITLLTLYLYAGELSRGRQKAQRGLFGPVLEENRRTTQTMAQMMEGTEKRMDSTEQALTKFASAIEAYAEHLQSHTSAIQGLSQASQELKKGAAEQNKVLTRLMEVMEQTMPKRGIEPAIPKAEKAQFPMVYVRSRQEPITQDKLFKAR